LLTFVTGEQKRREVKKSSEKLSASSVGPELDVSHAPLEDDILPAFRVGQRRRSPDAYGLLTPSTIPNETYQLPKIRDHTTDHSNQKAMSIYP